MPQINQLMDVYASQFFWLLLVIGIIYFVIGKGMLPKISRTVEDRAKKISDDLAAAQAAQAEVEAKEEQYRTMLNSAHENAASVVQTARATAAAQREASVKKADEKLAATAAVAEASRQEALSTALAEIEGVAAEAAKDIVARLSGAKVTATEAKKAVKAAF
jgi:F-type H+-transporting ATPase subunit b